MTHVNVMALGGLSCFIISENRKNSHICMGGGGGGGKNKKINKYF
jgi:hypothetical protein